MGRPPGLQISFFWKDLEPQLGSNLKGEIEPRQDKTGQDRAGQDKTRQDFGRQREAGEERRQGGVCPVIKGRPLRNLPPLVWKILCVSHRVFRIEKFPKSKFSPRSLPWPMPRMILSRDRTVFIVLFIEGPAHRAACSSGGPWLLRKVRKFRKVRKVRKYHRELLRPRGRKLFFFFVELPCSYSGFDPMAGPCENLGQALRKITQSI